jgi:predicted  nucleic acid-binding Zn-ribbon protein
MNPQQALYRLQTLESSIDQAKARLDAIARLLNDNETVQAAQQSYEAAQAAQHLAHSKRNDLELELAALSQKITETDQLIYSGRLTNHREIQERQAELESLQGRKVKLEDDLQAARLAESQAQAELDEAKSYLQAAQEDSAAQNKELVSEDGKLRHKMAKWLRERKSTLETVPPDHYKLYKQLKPQKSGVAVVRLTGNSCSFCQVEQTENLLHQIRHKKVVVQCFSCMRILVEEVI